MSVVAYLVGLACSPGSLAPASYGAELLACVDRAATRAEADACRAKVDAAYGQDGGHHD